MANTLIAGNAGDKLYQFSGMVASTTLKTSQSTTSWTTTPNGVSFDGVNTRNSSPAKYFNVSGLFSSTLKTSGLDTTAGNTNDIDCDGIDTLSSFESGSSDELIKTSGVFTTTVKASQPVVDPNPWGCSSDGTDTFWSGGSADKLYIQSGQYTSTIKVSLSVGAIDIFPNGIGWNGVDTPWDGDQANKMYLQSGLITSTMKTSVGIGGIETAPASIETDDFNARLGISSGGWLNRNYWWDNK